MKNNIQISFLNSTEAFGHENTKEDDDKLGPVLNVFQTLTG